MSQNYFIMLPGGPWAGPNSVQISGEKVDLLDGSLITKDFKEPFNFELRVDSQADNPLDFPPLDYFIGSEGRLLMSQRFIECLKNISVTNIQLFDTTTKYVPTGEFLPYKLVNIIGAISALDKEKSECIVDADGFVEAFETLSLDESKIKGFDIFRLYERLGLIVISKRVKECIISNGLTGIDIISDNEWEPEMI